MAEIWLHLDINPEPWAIGPVGYSRRNGKMSAYVGRNQQLDAYKNAVAEAVHEQWGELPMFDGERLYVSFYFWRNRAEYTTPSARTHRKHEADATNLQKACEDALQGVVYKNDKDNAVVSSVIMNQGPDVVGQIVIHIATLPEGYFNDLFDTAIPPATRLRVVQFAAQHVPDADKDPLSNNAWPPIEGAF